jgi:hypothetical protein
MSRGEAARLFRLFFSGECRTANFRPAADPDHGAIVYAAKDLVWLSLDGTDAAAMVLERETSGLYRIVTICMTLTGTVEGARLRPRFRGEIAPGRTSIVDEIRHEARALNKLARDGRTDIARVKAMGGEA